MSKWTEEEISILKVNWKKLTNKQLSFLVPRHSRDAVSRKMKRIGVTLSTEDRSWRASYAHSFVDYDNICRVDQSIKFNELDNQTKQVLLGSMLGDGCVSKQSSNLRNYRFVEGHGLKQKEYVFWKANLLSIFKPRVVINKSAELICKTHPIFTEFRSGFYLPQESNKSIIPINLIENLDLFGLMIWYLDDGSLGKKSWNLSIGVKGWKQDCIDEFVKMLNEKFSISSYVYECKHYAGTNKVVKIPHKDRKILDKWRELAVVAETPPCMMYKFGTK